MEDGKSVKISAMVDMLANGTFLDDIAEWISADSICNLVIILIKLSLLFKNTNKSSDGTTTGGQYSINGQDSSETANSDFSVAHNSTTGGLSTVMVCLIDKGQKS